MGRADDAPSIYLFFERYGNVIACLIIMLVAVFVIVSSRSFPATPVPADIGARAFPRMFSYLLLLLCSICIIAELVNLAGKAMRKGEEEGEEEERIVEEEREARRSLGGSKGGREIGDLKLPALAALLVAFYIVALPLLGYIFSSLIFLSMMIRLCGLVRPVINVLISCAITGFLYLLFEIILQVPLPSLALFSAGLLYV